MPDDAETVEQVITRLLNALVQAIDPILAGQDSFASVRASEIAFYCVIDAALKPGIRPRVLRAISDNMLVRAASIERNMPLEHWIAEDGTLPN